MSEEAAVPCVLYVEDDRINTILLQENLRAVLPECRLVCVESGAEALAHWADAQPDLALIDMHLADMGGIELLRQVRAAGHVTPCVAVSADNPLDLVRAAQDAGFAEYWLKPLDLDRLLRRLQQLRASPGNAAG
jgi:CheY-like chemotaxis protein